MTGGAQVFDLHTLKAFAPDNMSIDGHEVVVLGMTRGPADGLACMPAIAWRSGTGMVVWNEVADGAR